MLLKRLFDYKSLQTHTVKLDMLIQSFKPVRGDAVIAGASIF